MKQTRSIAVYLTCTLLLGACNDSHDKKEALETAKRTDEINREIEALRAEQKNYSVRSNSVTLSLQKAINKKCKNFTIKDLDSVKELEIVKTDTLKINDLEGLPNLVSIKLLNSIDVPKGYFSKVKSLERLEIGVIAQLNLNADFFIGLGKLKSLKINTFEAALIDKKFFSLLPKVTYFELYMLNSKVSSFPDYYFENLSSLTELKLTIFKNEINSEAFANLHKLKKLSIYSQIDTLPTSLFHLESIKEMNLVLPSISNDDKQALIKAYPQAKISVR